MQTRVEAGSRRRTTCADIELIAGFKRGDSQEGDEEGSTGPALHLPRRCKHVEPQSQKHEPEDSRSEVAPQVIPTEDGAGAAHRGASSRGYHDFHSKARLGDPQAQFELGLCYQKGLGVKAREDKAAKWLLRAAQQGLPRAQSEYAELLACGRGVKRNEDKALAWFKRAAAAEDPHALFWLAQFHEHGRGGLETCLNRAYDYYRTAAELGHVEAAYKQGACLWHGLGVQRDLAAAVALYMRAAECGSSDALWKLGLCYEHGWCVEQKSAAIAFTVFELAAKRGNVTGQFHLARCYWRGIGVSANRNEAFAWWLQSERDVQLRLQGLRLLMDDPDACERIGEVMDDYDADTAAEVQRIADYLATSQAEAQDSDDSAEQAELPRADNEEALEAGPSPETVDQAGSEPTPGVGRFKRRQLPRLQEVSEPSSTPSTESGNSEEDDADEDQPLECHVEAGEGNPTYG